MRHALIGLLLSAATLAPIPAAATVNVSIGINVPTYPGLVRIPNYPVYYAPSMRANYFFYDGLYWVFSNNTWYQSPWYNGPWYAVDPFDVPLFVLRVPVRYYSVQPTYFSGWAYDAPPRWGDYWGPSWETRHSGWERWSSAPAPAPLPIYQKSYSGSSYPVSVVQQATIEKRSYSYQPRETISRQQFQERRAQAGSVTPAKAGVQTKRETASTQKPKLVKQAKVQEPRAEKVKAQRAKPAPAQPEARVEHAQAQQEKREAHAQKQRAQRIQQAERKEQQRTEPKQKGKGHDRDDG